MSLFGAAYAAPNKGTTILYLFRSPKTVLKPPVNGKIQGLFKAYQCFQVLFKANLIFRDFSRQTCIFKYFSSLWEPCRCTVYTYPFSSYTVTVKPLCNCPQTFLPSVLHI